MSEATKFDISDVQKTARQVLTDPAAFYRTMPREGGYAQPLIFIGAVAIVTGILMAILSLFSSVHFTGMATGIASIIFMPIAMIIGCFIGSAIMFLIWKLMGSTQNYETAFRCQAFASAIFPITTLIGIIPYFGTIVTVIWGTWLVINSSIEVHAIARQKAMLVFGILGLLVIVSNINSERMGRQMQEHVENMDVNVEESLRNMENMSPEEAGKALGEFLKGLDQGTKTEQTAE